MSLRNLAYRFLRRGEKYTGTDNVYLAKGGFWFAFAQVFATCSSLLLAILFARFASKQAFGTYQYFLAFGSIFSVASMSGLSDALTQAVARGYDATIYKVLRTRLTYGLFGLAAALGFSGWYLVHHNNVLAVGFLIIGAFFPANAALSSWSDYAVGKKLFGHQSRIMVWGSTATAALLILTLFTFPEPLAFILVFCVAWSLTHLLALRHLLRRHPPTGASDPETIAFGKKLTFLDCFASIASYLDKLVIFWLLGAEMTAAYSLAIAPPEQIKGYLKNLYYLAMPKIAARPLEEIRKTFFRKFWLMTGVIAAGICVYIVLAPFLFRLVFPAYPEAIRLTQIFAIGLLGTPVALVTALFIGHKRTKENAQFQLITSAIGIIMLLVLIPPFGLIGAVLARVATRIIGLLLSVVLVTKVFKKP